MHIGKKDYIIQRALVIFSSSATSFFFELTYVQKNKSKQERKEQIPSRQSCFFFNNCNESTDYSCSRVTRIKWVLFNWPLLYCLVKSLRLVWFETERFIYIFAEIDQIWRAAELKKTWLCSFPVGMDESIPIFLNRWIQNTIKPFSAMSILWRHLVKWYVRWCTRPDRRISCTLFKCWLLLSILKFHN